MTASRHLVVDTDTGIDDALALLYLAAQPEVELAAVTAVYGNCVIEDALRNIAHVLDLVGLAGVPVARGASGPDRHEAHIAHYVHGRDGLGDVVTEKKDPANLVAESASELLLRLASERPGHYDLLTLGPLTNVALALETDPELLTRFASVTVMGGSGPFPALGGTDMVDANVQNDPEAARAVFSAPARRRLMVGVNATSRVVTDEQHILALQRSGTPTGMFAASILEAYLDFYRLAWGRRVSPVHDGLAAGLLLHPEWITGQRTGPVNIVSDGFATRARLMETAEGRAVPWTTDPAPDSDVVTAVDSEAFLRSFLTGLVGAPARPPR